MNRGRAAARLAGTKVNDLEHSSFLESAVIMVPSLTGMNLSVYTGDPSVLAQFQDGFCFSPQLQPIYTQTGLDKFFADSSEAAIYHIAESLGTRLIILCAKGYSLLLGPYVEDGWRERAARRLLAELGASESALPMYKAYRCQLPVVQQDFAVRTAFLLAENLRDGPWVIEPRWFQPRGSGSGLTFADAYANASEVNLRYWLEDRVVEAMSQGDAEIVRQALTDMGKASTGVCFLSDSLQDQVASAAMTRTLIRLGAKRSGLSPVLVDSISQEYAQKMHRSISKKEMSRLMSELIERFCAEIRERRRSRLSPTVRRAADYMEVNLSKSMTTAEIAQAAGEERQRFVRQFRRETGMTVKEYLADRRCAVAAQLLLDSEASVQDIAAFVGYPDNNYFSKVFKTCLGVPPQTYRNTHGKAGPSL